MIIFICHYVVHKYYLKSPGTYLNFKPKTKSYAAMQVSRAANTSCLAIRFNGVSLIGMTIFPRICNKIAIAIFVQQQEEIDLL